MSENSRTCVVRVSDGSRAGQLNLEHGEVVQISFGQLEGASAMLALMAAAELRHEVIEMPPAERADIDGESPLVAARAPSVEAAESQTDVESQTDDEALDAADVLDAEVADASDDDVLRAVSALDGFEAADEDGGDASDEDVLRAVDALDSLEAADEDVVDDLEDEEDELEDEVDAALDSLEAGDADLGEPARAGEPANADAHDGGGPTEDDDAERDAELAVASAVASAADPTDVGASPELDSEAEIGDTVRRPRRDLEDEALLPLAEMVADALRELEADAPAEAAGFESAPSPSHERPPEPTYGHEHGPELEHAHGPELEYGHERGPELAAVARHEADSGEAPPLHETLEPPVIRPVAARRSDRPPAAESAAHAWFAPVVLLGMLAPIAIAVLLWKPDAPRTAAPPAKRASVETAMVAALEAPAAAISATNAPPAPPAPPAPRADGPPEWLEGAPLQAPKDTLIPTVLLRVLVGTDGRVRAAEVQSPRAATASLEQQALEAVKSHRFRPAAHDGNAVEAWTVLPLAFTPAPVERALVIKGADTLAGGLGAAWTQAFEKTQPGLRIQVDALGSQAGLASLLDGSAELAFSSRAIDGEELALAEKLGLSLRELAVGYDGIAIIVHPDNPVRELDLDAVAQVFAQRVTRWSELAGGEAPIHALGRPSYSGTRRAFEARVLAGRTPEGAFGSGVETLESSQQVVARVASDPHAIGYVSLGLVQPSVRALAVRPGRDAPAVAASPATLRDGSYPLLRPLLLYLRADSTRDARAFADFTRSPDGQAALAQHGFIPLPSLPQEALREEVPAAAHRADLLRIYFEPGTSVVAGEWGELDAAAAALRSGRRALIIGHTDSTGQSAVNLRVAQRRAEVVAAQLKQRGSGDAPIELDAAGDGFPLGTNASPEGRSLNRRADLYVLPR